MIFQRKKDLLHNLVYMGLMAAINVIFVLIAFFVPALLFIVVFLLPLTSTVVTLHCKKRYYIIYAVATFGICLLCTLSNFMDTLFFVLPSLITGFLFGLGIEKKIPLHYLIIATALIQVGFSYASIPLIKAFFNVDIIETFVKLFKLETFKYLNLIVPCFILALALAQSTISSLVIRYAMPKFGVTFFDEKQTWISPTIIILSSLLSFCFVFGPKEVVFFFFIIAIFACFYEIAILIYKKKWISLIVSGVALIASIILYICLYKTITEPFAILLFLVFPIAIAIIVLFNNYCLNKHNKDTI